MRMGGTRRSNRAQLQWPRRRAKTTRMPTWIGVINVGETGEAIWIRQMGSSTVMIAGVLSSSISSGAARSPATTPNIKREEAGTSPHDTSHEEKHGVRHLAVLRCCCRLASCPIRRWCQDWQKRRTGARVRGTRSGCVEFFGDVVLLCSRPLSAVILNTLCRQDVLYSLSRLKPTYIKSQHLSHVLSLNLFFLN